MTASSSYSDRQELEFFQWPELKEIFTQLAALVMTAENSVSRQLRAEVFTMASIAGGCQHCQAHGGFSLSLMGVDPERIRDIWNFEQSDAFANAEKAALRLARDAAQVPNLVEPGHFDSLREHFSNQAIRELLAVVSLAGWYNRWNNSIATVTDQELVDWASEHLSQVGWERGKHQGDVHEQRRHHPRSDDLNKVKY